MDFALCAAFTEFHLKHVKQMLKTRLTRTHTPNEKVDIRGIELRERESEKEMWGGGLRGGNLLKASTLNFQLLPVRTWLLASHTFRLEFTAGT